MEQEKMEEIESLESSETANYNENIFMLTALTDTAAVKSLQHANVNRQLQDLIT